MMCWVSACDDRLMLMVRSVEVPQRDRVQVSWPRYLPASFRAVWSTRELSWRIRRGALQRCRYVTTVSLISAFDFDQVTCKRGSSWVIWASTESFLRQPAGWPSTENVEMSWNLKVVGEKSGNLKVISEVRENVISCLWCATTSSECNRHEINIIGVQYHCICGWQCQATVCWCLCTSPECPQDKV